MFSSPLLYLRTLKCCCKEKRLYPQHHKNFYYIYTCDERYGNDDDDDFDDDERRKRRGRRRGVAPVRASSFTPRSRVGRGGRGVVQEETHGRVQSELRDGVRLARPGDGDDSDAGKEASRTDAPRIEVEGFGVVGGRGRQNADFDARDDGTDATRAHRTMTTMCNESLCGMLKFVCVLL